MGISRKFLPWNQPALVGAVDELCQRYADSSSWDLSPVIVVVPGARAGRRLLELMVDQAAARSLFFVPPRIVTIGGLPELLYEPKRPFADALTQQLAWAQALGEMRGRLSSVFSRLPEGDRDPGWRELGDVLRREHTELAADALDFGDVAQLVPHIAGPAETARWQTLHEVQQRYLRILDDLQLWDRQTARLKAIEFSECRSESDLILVGTVDLNRAQRQMLDQVASRVTALIHAPPAWRNRFDEHGCLLPDQWRTAPIDLPDARIQLAASPDDQADAVVGRIASWEGRFRADEITVGLPSELLVPEIERKLRQCGLPVRWGPGRPVGQTTPHQLCVAIREHLQRDDYASFAALVRHPDLGDWLAAQGVGGDWLSQLDAYHNAHLPTQLGQPWLGPPEDCAALRQLHAQISLLLAPLRMADRSLGDWADAWRHVVADVYGRRKFDKSDDHSRQTLRACELLFEAFDTLTQVPIPLQPQLSAGEAIDIALALIASKTMPAPDEDVAIEILGWLELPLDDAPALIVAGFNDGAVPEAANADPFLPNALRSQLGINDNARRYARDAYALSVLLASRPEVHLIVGRQDVEGNPLAPSRLLFACDDESVARRMAWWCQAGAGGVAPEAKRAGRFGEFRPTRAKPDFERPDPAAVLPRLAPDRPSTPLALRVTDFKSYRECPYRYFLRRVAHLEPLDDLAEELDGGSFGTLAHEVLREFGRGPQRDQTDPRVIEAFLTHDLDQRVCDAYGSSPRPAVRVQVEQLRRRLIGFAAKQAARAAQGWRIQHVEDNTKQQRVEILLGDEPVTLVGRIDRIDVHPELGMAEVFDYKTSDRAVAPKTAHRSRDEWVDFQLPLYRHLARGLGIKQPIRLGYIVLPKDVSQIDFLIADWDESELAAADAAAGQIARSIRERKFSEIAELTSYDYDTFARICQVGVLR